MPKKEMQNTKKVERSRPQGNHPNDQNDNDKGGVAHLLLQICNAEALLHAHAEGSYRGHEE